MKSFKVEVIVSIVMIGIILMLSCLSMEKIYRPEPKTKEPFTIVCKIGNKEESFAAVDYVIENGSCIFTTDDGHKIVVSDYAIFVDEPYYAE